MCNHSCQKNKPTLKWAFHFKNLNQFVNGLRAWNKFVWNSRENDDRYEIMKKNGAQLVFINFLPNFVPFIN